MGSDALDARWSTGGVLACPHCGLTLQLAETGATCATGHSFDRGRGGYLNLLVGGRLGATTTPGDTPDALAARRRFLGAGHYAPIAAAMSTAVGVPGGPLLDVGCGEGYYLSQLPLPDRYGLDVSKSAVQMAARFLPDAQFVVGSAYRLPVSPGSLAAVISVFAPHPFDEFHRVLRPGGRWVTVTPGPDHLQQMRPLLAGDAQRKASERLERREVPPVEAETATRVQFDLHLDAASLRELFFMTPIQWQAGATGADTEHGRTVSVDVWVCSATHDGGLQ